MSQQKNDALSAAMNFNKLAGAKQKNFQIEFDDGTKKMVTIEKWTVSQQLEFLPMFGMLFSPLLEKFTNIIFSGQGKSNAGDVFEEDTITSADILGANSVYMFFNFLSSSGNLNAILSMVLNNVSIQGKKAELDSFDDIDQVMLVAIEVLKFNYGRLISGKGFSGFLNASMQLSKSQAE